MNEIPSPNFLFRQARDSPSPTSATAGTVTNRRLGRRGCSEYFGGAYFVERGGPQNRRDP